MMKKLCLIISVLMMSDSFASNIVPVGSDNSLLYYKIGGGSDFAMPPVTNNDSVTLNTNTNLGLGLSCSAFNPAFALVSSLNDIKKQANDLDSTLIANLTGAIIGAPMYVLAKTNPTLYALINNKLLAANQKLELSTKSCEVAREQIARGQNPYQEWGQIAVNDQWKRKLSLENQDMNESKKEIDAHGGDDGAPWVTGRNKDNVFYAGGVNQPPVHVINDTAKAGYNVILNRDVNSMELGSSEIAKTFPNPQSAADWLTSVVGDHVITTCSSKDCAKAQSSVVGHGLVPWVTSCKLNSENCVETIRRHLANLVTGSEEIKKDNLEAVSAGGTAISPDVIASIRSMDATQQSIVVNKLAQEIAMQRVLDKALLARNILSTGAQVPVIASNHPAQVIIGQAITNLDNDIRSLTFESQIRKQMMSDTLSQVMNYSSQQQRQTMQIKTAPTTAPIMENGAVTKPVKVEGGH